MAKTNKLGSFQKIDGVLYYEDPKGNLYEARKLEENIYTTGKVDFDFDPKHQSPKCTICGQHFSPENNALEVFHHFTQKHQAGGTTKKRITDVIKEKKDTEETRRITPNNRDEKGRFTKQPTPPVPAEPLIVDRSSEKGEDLINYSQQQETLANEQEQYIPKPLPKPSKKPETTEKKTKKAKAAAEKVTKKVKNVKAAAVSTTTKKTTKSKDTVSQETRKTVTPKETPAPTPEPQVVAEVTDEVEDLSKKKTSKVKRVKKEPYQPPDDTPNLAYSIYYRQPYDAESQEVDPITGKVRKKAKARPVRPPKVSKKSKEDEAWEPDENLPNRAYHRGQWYNAAEKEVDPYSGRLRRIHKARPEREARQEKARFTPDPNLPGLTYSSSGKPFDGNKYYEDPYTGRIKKIQAQKEPKEPKEKKVIGPKEDPVVGALKKSNSFLERLSVVMNKDKVKDKMEKKYEDMSFWQKMKAVMFGLKGDGSTNLSGVVDKATGFANKLSGNNPMIALGGALLKGVTHLLPFVVALLSAAAPLILPMLAVSAAAFIFYKYGDKMAEGIDKIPGVNRGITELRKWTDPEFAKSLETVGANYKQSYEKLKAKGLNLEGDPEDTEFQKVIDDALKNPSKYLSDNPEKGSAFGDEIKNPITVKIPDLTKTPESKVAPAPKKQSKPQPEKSWWQKTWGTLKEMGHDLLPRIPGNSSAKLDIKKFADAIQQHEGWYPGSSSYRNNNPGNLGKGSNPRRFYPNKKRDPKTGVITFDNYAEGRAALEKDLRIKVGRGMTMEQLIHMYAPPHENNTEAYIQKMVKELGVPRNVRLTSSNSNAIQPFENSNGINLVKQSEENYLGRYQTVASTQNPSQTIVAPQTTNIGSTTNIMTSVSPRDPEDTHAWVTRMNYVSA